MTTITSLSFDLGSGPMMSILISYHGSLDVSNGWSSSTFFIYCTLFYWHFWHHWTYFFMLFHIPSHQSFLLINLSILYCSGSFLSHRPLCCPPMLACLSSFSNFFCTSYSLVLFLWIFSEHYYFCFCVNPSCSKLFFKYLNIFVIILHVYLVFSW